MEFSFLMIGKDVEIRDVFDKWQILIFMFCPTFDDFCNPSGVSAHPNPHLV